MGAADTLSPTVPAVEQALERSLARAAAKAEQARKDRDAQIVLAFIGGAGLREIARAVNMTHPAVKYILEKNAEDPELIEEFRRRNTPKGRTRPRIQDRDLW